MLDTLIFDGSGVLFDDLYTVWKADSAAFDACGLGRIPTLEQFKKEFRLPISEYCIAKGASSSLLPRLEEEFRRAYPKYSSHIKVFPEVKSVLKKLKRRRIVMAVTSNMPSPFLNEHLQNFGLDMYFDTIIGQDDCEEKKPSPMPILITLERLDRKPSTSAYVGDMEEDIIAGKKANVITFALSRKESYHPSWRLKRQNPDFLISDLNGILTIINNH